MASFSEKQVGESVSKGNNQYQTGLSLSEFVVERQVKRNWDKRSFELQQLLKFILFFCLFSYYAKREGILWFSKSSFLIKFQRKIACFPFSRFLQLVVNSVVSNYSSNFTIHVRCCLSPFPLKQEHLASFGQDEFVGTAKVDCDQKNVIGDGGYQKGWVGLLAGDIPEIVKPSLHNNCCVMNKHYWSLYFVKHGFNHRFCSENIFSQFIEAVLERRLMLCPKLQLVENWW